MDDTVIGSPGTLGVTGTTPNGTGGTGGAGGDANATANASGDTSNTARAQGGAGGSGGMGGGPNGNGGAGGAGGDADAVAATVAANAGTAVATATATGGAGGYGGDSGSAGAGQSGAGGAGGTASGSATAVNTAGDAQAILTVFGGVGGGTDESGNGGAGGTITDASASAVGTDAAQASVTAIGGTGANAGFYGEDLTPFSAGQGGSVTLVNAVSGSTTDQGTLTLSQAAAGGAGGAVDAPYGNPGDGGDASSTLTLDDAISASPSSVVIVSDEATGGRGGYGYDGGFYAPAEGNGGSADAIVDVTGSASVDVTARAEGGTGEAGGAAAAQATATGTLVNSTATAVGGDGGDVALPADAVASATGLSGTATASAQISYFGHFVPHEGYEAVGTIEAMASSSVLGTTRASSAAHQGGSLLFDTTDQAVAAGVSGPTDASNPYFTTQLAAELGGGAKAGTATTATATSTLSAEVITPADQAGTAEFYIDQVTLVGAGVTAVDLDITSVGGRFHQSFTSGAAAEAYLDHRLITLGPSYFVDATMSLTVTTDDSSSGFYAEIEAGTGVPCYCHGTMLLTPGGEVAVEALRIGDSVTTHSGAARPIKWIGRRAYGARFIAGRRDMLPIRFHAGSLGSGLPHRDLLVSPHHAMLVEDVLVPAELLVNGATITAEYEVAQLEYFHVELETHDILIAEGAPAESFVDCDSRGMFQNAAEFRALYPEADPPRWQRCAPLIEDGPALASIHRRLARSGSAQGPLRGHVDAIADGFVAGWARDCRDPARLVLEIDGQAVSRMVANRYRADLEQAGMSGGRHGFRTSLPRLDRARNHLLRVLREADGAELDGSPLLLPRLLHREWRGADAQSLIAAADRLSRSA